MALFFPFVLSVTDDMRIRHNRRFHAEPNACIVCGPKLNCGDAEGKIIPCESPLEKAIELSLRVIVLAIKGLGWISFMRGCDKR